MHYWNLGIINHKYWFMLPRKGKRKILFFLKFCLKQPVETEEGKLKTILTTEGGFSS